MPCDGSIARRSRASSPGLRFKIPISPMKKWKSAASNRSTCSIRQRRSLDPLAEKHTDYLLELARLMPRVKIHSAKAESLGGGIFRITVVVLNEGYLPTSCEMGRITGQVYPLYLRLTAPQGTHYITGTPRTELGRLRGGEKTEWTWLVRPPEGGAKPAEATIRVSAPAVGSDSATLELK